MGSFYTNITLRGATQQSVAEALVGRTCYVSREVDGHIIVTDARCDEQREDELAVLAQQLSARFSVPTVAVMNHDDDVLWLYVFDRGVAVGGEYVSAPGYFSGEKSPPRGGDSSAIARTFGIADRETNIERILRTGSEDYTFAFQRHTDFARALGLPEQSVGFGYTYIAGGDLPGELTEDDILRTA
jgi:hypothetical protein